MPEQVLLNHLSNDGKARMVDVGGKTPTSRTARAEAVVSLNNSILTALRERGGLVKGNVIETARIAGIMAAKRTAELIPMCHPLPLDRVSVEITKMPDGLRIETEVRTRGVTGVEMEALTAASVAALTIYDMCKSAGKGITISRIRLIEKSGGKSGPWRADLNDSRRRESFRGQR